MQDETQRVLQAILDNGMEVEVRRTPGRTHVQVVDLRRRAEASFSFDAAEELATVKRLARQYCSMNQLEEFFADSESAMVCEGPYRYAMA